MKKKKLLIVGGTGFIGYWLAKKCLSKNFLVFCLSQHKPKKVRFLKKVKYIICDITNIKNLKKKIPKKIDYIINLAGYVNHTEKKKTFNSHFNGCKNLVSLTKDKKIKLFIQMSSGGEYEGLNSPHYETDKLKKPIHTYNLAKYYATKNLLKFYQKIKYPVMILRLYQVFGPKQDINRLIPIVIESALKKKVFPCSHGRHYKDFIYIDDLVNLIMSCLNSKYYGEVFNVGSGKSLNIKYIINYITNKIKSGVPQFGKIKLRNDEKKNYYPDISKVKRYLKWKPKISFLEGLDKTIKFYKKEYKKDLLDNYK